MDIERQNQSGGCVGLGAAVGDEMGMVGINEYKNKIPGVASHQIQKVRSLKLHVLTLLISRRLLPKQININYSP